MRSPAQHLPGLLGVLLVIVVLVGCTRAPAPVLGPPPARPQAPWPPPPGPLPVIIDTDAANEVDDIYALALALGFPERLRLEGIVAAHFGETGGTDGIARSYDDIQEVLARAGMAGRFPVKRGAA